MEIATNIYTIYVGIMKALMIFIAFFIVVQIYNLITSIIIHIKTRTESVKLIDKNRMINRLEVRVSSTTAILKLIDAIIDNEVLSALKTYARLGESYKSINTADDIAKISNKVFNAIKKEIFEDNDTVITDEYLMTYINEQTTLAFLIESKKLINGGV